jgi:hypothetical protein
LPTFLAKTEWKTIPWSINPTSKDIIHHLLDHVSDIPGLLARYDVFVQAINANSTSHFMILNQRLELYTLVADLEHRLHQWKREWADISGQYFEVPHSVETSEESPIFSASDDQLPVFRYQDPLSSEIISPTSIAYHHPKLAIAFNLYYTALLVISSTGIRTEASIQFYELYDFARLICRSVKYYMQTFPGNEIIQILFPLRTAFDFFPEGSLEKEWIRKVFLLIGEARRMKVFESLGRAVRILESGSEG